MAFAVGGQDLEFARIQKSENVAGDCQKGRMLSASKGSLPEDGAAFGVEAENAASSVVGESVEQAVVHHGGAHIQRDFFLPPLFFGRPAVAVPCWLDATDAAVFAADDHLPVVNCGCGHVLVVAHMREGILPKTAAGCVFHADKGVVVPLDDLANALNFGNNWGGVGGAVVALTPDFTAGFGVQSNQSAFFIAAKVDDDSFAVHQRRGCGAPVRMRLVELAAIIAPPERFARSGFVSGKDSCNAHCKNPTVCQCRGRFWSLAVTFASKSHFERHGVALAPLGGACFQVQAPKRFFFALTGVLKNESAGDEGRAVAAAHFGLPDFSQLFWPLLGRLKVLCPTVAVGSQPARPMRFRSGQRLQGAGKGTDGGDKD